MPEQEPVPMEAFDGAAKDGIGLDAAALAMAQNADIENRNDWFLLISKKHIIMM